MEFGVSKVDCIFEDFLFTVKTFSQKKRKLIGNFNTRIFAVRI